MTPFGFYAALKPPRHHTFYNGGIEQLCSTSTSRRLCDVVLSQVSFARQMPHCKIYHALAPVRQSLSQNKALKQAYRQLFVELGIHDFSQWAIDVPRLRTIVPGAELNPRAQTAYYAHRDTWYANPAEQINLWLPLQDYAASQTFCFWPQQFKNRVKNNSSEFKLSQWQGFQKSNLCYPRPHSLGALEKPTGFSTAKGNLLLFSARHLHQTLPNPGPEVRYSLDIRLLYLPEHVCDTDTLSDNASEGCTCSQYTYLDQEV